MKEELILCIFLLSIFYYDLIAIIFY